jgi:hypothetical protein
MSTQYAHPDIDLELYQSGDEVPCNGQYAIVNANGDRQDYDEVWLDEGDVFPELKERDACYVLTVSEATSNQSHSLVIAGPILTTAPPSEDLI